jgi:hypothetical protein
MDSRPFADPGQRAVLGIDLVPMQHAACADSARRESAVWRDIDVGCVGRIFLVVIASVDTHHFQQGYQCPFGSTRCRSSRSLSDEIAPFAIWVDGRMARAADLGSDYWRIVWRRHAGVTEICYQSRVAFDGRTPGLSPLFQEGKEPLSFPADALNFPADALNAPKLLQLPQSTTPPCALASRSRSDAQARGSSAGLAPSVAETPHLHCRVQPSRA